MKKILTTVLAAALLVGTCAIGAMSVSGAELTATDILDDQPLSGRCGAFIDDDIRFAESLNVDSLTDIAIEINGAPAYWNIGYLGQKHCQLGANGEVANAWIQCGIVGAQLNVGENTITLTMGDSGDTYTQTFNSANASRGVAYSRVVANSSAKTVTAEIIYNEDPGYKVDDELTGKCHDDHNNTAAFKVTAVDGKKVTLVAENYTTNQSLLELVDADGVYTTATINTKTGSFIGDKKITQEATKITITEATANRGTAANLLDGNSNTKLEGNAPSDSDPVTVTFKTESAVKPDYFVIYTGNDDGSWANRAPNAFKLYGVAADGTETVILEKSESGMLNYNYTPFAYELATDTAYDTFKLVITSRISLPLEAGQQENGWFQFGAIELYTGSVSVSDSDRYDSVTGPFAYNGTAPEGDDPTTPPTGENPTVTEPAETTPETSGTTPETTTTAPVTSGDAPTTTAATPSASSGTPASSTPTTTAAPATSGSNSNSSDDEGGSALPIIIAVVAVVVVGGAVAAVLIIKKKKA